MVKFDSFTQKLTPNQVTQTYGKHNFTFYEWYLRAKLEKRPINPQTPTPGAHEVVQRKSG